MTANMLLTASAPVALCMSSKASKSVAASKRRKHRLVVIFGNKKKIQQICANNLGASKFIKFRRLFAELYCSA